MRLRSKRLTDAARDEPCVSCGAPHSVFAHLPNPGDAGMGQKTDDYWGAFLCALCHSVADQGWGRRDYKWRATIIHRTQRRLWARGLIRVGDTDAGA